MHHKCHHKEPGFLMYDYSGSMLMRDYWLQEYEKWKKEQPVQKTKEEQKSEEWRFQWGDVVPRQGWTKYSEYIRDAACLISTHETDIPARLVEEDGEYYYYFGIKKEIF